MNLNPVLPWLRGFCLCCSVLVMGVAPAAFAADLKVVTSIRPVHGLASALMDGVGKPILLLDQRQSVHVAALRPSGTKHLQNADLVFWIGPGVAVALARPMETVTRPGAVIQLSEAPGLVWRELSDEELAAHAHHDQHDEGHDEHHDEHHDEDHDEHHDEDHDEHHDEGHDEHHDEDHDEHADHGDEHGHDDAHAEDENHRRDWHIWLNPANVTAMARYMATHMERADPDNAAIYQSNLTRLIQALEATDKAIKAKTSPATYIAIHDAYGYLADHYGLSSAGSLSIGHDVSPSVKDVTRLQAVMREKQADCLLTDPTSSPSLVRLMSENSSIPVIMMDQFGFDIAAGPDYFPKLLADLGAGLARCTHN